MEIYENNNHVSEPTDQAIGFTAYGTVSRTFALHDVVIFDGIISNFGNNYHTDSSIYLCPKSGVYGFGMTILTDDYFMNARLMREKAVLVGLQEHALHNTGSVSVVTECLKGEKVWVRTVSEPTSYHGSEGRRSVFWGYLLYHY